MKLWFGSASSTPRHPWCIGADYSLRRSTPIKLTISLLFAVLTKGEKLFRFLTLRYQKLSLQSSCPSGSMKGKDRLRTRCSTTHKPPDQFFHPPTKERSPISHPEPLSWNFPVKISMAAVEQGRKPSLWHDCNLVGWNLYFRPIDSSWTIPRALTATDPYALDVPQSRYSRAHVIPSDSDKRSSTSTFGVSVSIQTDRGARSVKLNGTGVNSIAPHVSIAALGDAADGASTGGCVAQGHGDSRGERKEGSDGYGDLHVWIGLVWKEVVQLVK